MGEMIHFPDAPGPIEVERVTCRLCGSSLALVEPGTGALVHIPGWQPPSVEIDREGWRCGDRAACEHRVLTARARDDRDTINEIRDRVLGLTGIPHKGGMRQRKALADIAELVGLRLDRSNPSYWTITNPEG